MALILSGDTGVPVTTVTGTLPEANGGSGVTTSTGTGANVLGTSPTITGATLTTATFTAMPATTTAQSMVRLTTANGYGSTNTVIRRFTTVTTNQGSDITYADSATLGATFTINTNGVYAISYSDDFSASAPLGISLNSTQLTSSIYSITAANSLIIGQSAAASQAGTASITLYLIATDVIRAHTGGTTTGGNGSCRFTITRVA